jgi:hypothetical protein
MASEFLSNFMRLAQTLTGAERCLAFDLDMAVQDRMNIDDGTLQAAEFNALLNATVHEALGQNESIITNNLITNPADAPQTNWHLHDLRMVVAIPLQGHGAIYLDQQVRKGVFERETIDRLTALGRQIIEEARTDLSEKDLADRYTSITL